MGHRGEAPESHGHRVTRPGTEAIDEASDKQHAGRIGDLEVRNEMAVLDVVPAEVVLQRGLQYAEQLTIHVIFCYAEEKEGADDPTEIAHARYDWGGGNVARLHRVEARCQGAGWRNRGRGIHFAEGDYRNGLEFCQTGKFDGEDLGGLQEFLAPLGLGRAEAQPLQRFR